MSCEKFEKRLHQRLDRREDLAGDAVLARHATACPVCRETFQTYCAMFDVLEQAPIPELPADFAARVVSQVWAERPTIPDAVAPAAAASRSLRRSKEWAVALAVAATLLVAAAPFALWWTLSFPWTVPSAAPVHVVESTPAAPQLPSVPVPPPSEREALAVAPASVEPEKVGARPVASLENLLPLDPLTAPLPAIVHCSQGMEERQTVDPNEELSPESQTELMKNSTAWGRQMSIGFRPLADTVNATLRVIRNALGEKNAPKGSVPSPQAEQRGFDAWMPLA